MPQSHDTRSKGINRLNSGSDGLLPQLRPSASCDGFGVRVTSGVWDEMVDGPGVDELGTRLVEGRDT